MAITSILDVRFTPGSAAEGGSHLTAALADTRAFDGCLGVDVLVDIADENHWTLLERWESVEHDDAYRAFRAGPGALTEVARFLAGPPTLARYTAQP